MSDSGTPVERWTSGNAYEAYVGRWSRLVAAEFVRWLDRPPGERWLDMGCGTGELSNAILQAANPRSIIGIDRSDGYVEYARERIQDERARFEVGDAHALPVEDATVDAAVSGLVLNFVAQPAAAVAEMVRAARPGGTIAAYLWDYAGKMQMMRHFWNAATALDPAAASFDQGRRFPLCQAEPLHELFEAAGLNGVEVRPIDIATDFRDFDDLWTPFLGAQGAAPAYVASLGEERLATLRERLRSSVPFALDGTIPLVARAWAVRGTRPMTGAGS